MIKNVFFLLLIGAVIGYLFQSKILFLGNKTQSARVSPAENKSVLGAQSSTSSADLGSIQSEISHLKVTDISSASPQIQKILHDLQKYPASQARQICENLCGAIK